MEHNQFQDAENYGTIANSKTVLNASGTSVINHSAGISSNKTLFKGLITAGLILVMLIPTTFVRELVKERESRQRKS